MLLRPLFRLLGSVLLLATVTDAASSQNVLRASGQPLLVVGDATDSFAHPTWSPDGTRLALTRSGYAGLWTVAPDGEALQQVTDETGAGFGFSWSPDGKALLTRVSQTEGRQRTSAVKVFDVERATSETLTDYRTRMAALPQWSADGEAVFLFTGEGLETFSRSDAAPANAEARTSTDPTFVTTGDMLAAVRLVAAGVQSETLMKGQRILNAVASPDRARVAFEIVGGDLYVIDADGTGLTNLGPGHRPSWSPDGRWVVFMRTEDDGERFTASDIYATRTDGSALVQLTQTTGRLEMNPSWSPDGRTIAFDALDEGAVYLLPLAQ